MIAEDAAVPVPEIFLVVVGAGGDLPDDVGVGFVGAVAGGELGLVGLSGHGGDAFVAPRLFFHLFFRGIEYTLRFGGVDIGRVFLFFVFCLLLVNEALLLTARF